MSGVNNLTFNLGNKKYTIYQDKNVTKINVAQGDGDTKYYNITKGKDTVYRYNKDTGKKSKETALDFPGGGWSALEMDARIELERASAEMEGNLDCSWDGKLALNMHLLDMIIMNMISTVHGLDY